MADVDDLLDLVDEDEAAAAWDEVAGPSRRARSLGWLVDDAASRTLAAPWLRVGCVLAAAAARGAFPRVFPSGAVGGSLAAKARRDLHRRDLRARSAVLAELARVAVRSAGTLGAASLDALAPLSTRRSGLCARVADELGRAPIPSMLDEARAALAGGLAPASSARAAAWLEVDGRTAGAHVIPLDDECAQEDARRSAAAIEVAGGLLSLACALGDGFEVRLAAREVAIAVGRCGDDAPTADLRRLARDGFAADDAIDRVEIARAVALGRFAEASRALEEAPFAFERDVAIEALRCTAAALAGVAGEGSPVPGGRVVAGCDAPGASAQRRAARLLLGLERYRGLLARTRRGAPPPTRLRTGARRRRRR